MKFLITVEVDDLDGETETICFKIDAASEAEARQLLKDEEDIIFDAIDEHFGLGSDDDEDDFYDVESIQLVSIDEIKP
jgi:hypothetical protein